ncbi:hypothetical protein CkaCkLH20_06250 [Colletotrichum karsti]|uniref:Large ribosomal subunit protein bL33m n=1 Tax=Colletotrichum karsti TaxID=1095194 RepID=A0A9P6I5V5_9PEZI|nr:uncharacterized protein CkaCkLH20_06250 [Colletotrichum karsti]KAF9876307.1 hypothetical protein CkaCkLH20_06250 [Colletotrichum karsti]
MHQLVPSGRFSRLTESSLSTNLSSKISGSTILPRPSRPIPSSKLPPRATTLKMAKKTKSRVMIVRLMSMAATGFFYTFKRPRTASPMSMLKYDPIIRRKVLFLEQKKKGK